jgi:hypothetical protein
MLGTETKLVTLAKKEEGLSIIIASMPSIYKLLVALVIINISSAGFLVVLPVSYIKTTSTAVNIEFLSTGFLVILIIVKFLLYMKAELIITRPRLLGTGLLIVIVTGFPATNVISIR